MNREQAAQLLGVAPYTVLSVEHDEDGWVAVVRHMATHEDERHALPVVAAAPVDEVPAADEVPAEESDAPVTLEAPAVDEDVPDGTVAEVLEWVGDDVARACAALEAEEARDKPRAGVTGPLEKLVAES